eukprot:5846144-Amphidinium_carterae.1
MRLLVSSFVFILDFSRHWADFAQCTGKQLAGKTPKTEPRVRLPPPALEEVNAVEVVPQALPMKQAGKVKGEYNFSYYDKHVLEEATQAAYCWLVCAEGREHRSADPLARAPPLGPIPFSSPKVLPGLLMVVRAGVASARFLLRWLPIFQAWSAK